MIKIFKTEGMHSPEIDKLVSLFDNRCKALAAVYGSEPMQQTELRLPGL